MESFCDKIKHELKGRNNIVVSGWARGGRWCCLCHFALREECSSSWCARTAYRDHSWLYLIPALSLSLSYPGGPFNEISFHSMLLRPCIALTFAHFVFSAQVRAFETMRDVRLCSGTLKDQLRDDGEPVNKQWPEEGPQASLFGSSFFVVEALSGRSLMRQKRWRRRTKASKLISQA